MRLTRRSWFLCGVVTVLFFQAATGLGFGKETTIQAAAPTQDAETFEAMHQANLDVLHTLNHQMRKTVKQLKGRQDVSGPIQRFDEHLHALRAALTKVEETEREHPQWANNWSKNYAKLLDLSQNMEGAFQSLKQGREKKHYVRHLGHQIRTMQAILEFW